MPTFVSISFRFLALAWIFASLGVSTARGAVFFVDGFENSNPSALDELRLRSTLDSPAPSSAQVEALLELVANNGGWPIATPTGTFLFAANCGATTWSIAGDFTGGGQVPMTRYGPLCWAEIAIANPLEMRYRFITPAPLPDPRARRYRYEGAVEVSLVRADAEHLERWFAFGPQVGLLPRKLQILVPTARNYDRVLYMHDGQNLFDPNAFFGGWNLQASVSSGVLVVGIDNTADRFDEYTHVQDDLGGVTGGDGDIYAALVHETIRPWVEQRYGPFVRHGLLGSSLGGLISLHIAQVYPGAYDFAGSMSGVLGWGSFAQLDNITMIERYAQSGHGATAIYLDSGGSAGSGCVDNDADGIDDDGDDEDNFCVTLQMRDTLVGLGYLLGTDLFYVHTPGATHTESAWSARFPGVLSIFLGQ